MGAFLDSPPSLHKKTHANRCAILYQRNKILNFLYDFTELKNVLKKVYVKLTFFVIFEKEM